MAIEFDPDKDATNLAKHHISLARAAEMEIQVFIRDSRRDYGEVRYRSWGLIDGQAFCLVFTERNGQMRAISLRRAHDKEMRRHVPQSGL